MFKVPTKELAERRRGGKVRQANALIRSKQPLDLMQKRLFYVILETVRTTDTQLSDVEFPVPLLKELLNGSYRLRQLVLGVAVSSYEDALVGVVSAGFLGNSE